MQKSCKASSSYGNVEWHVTDMKKPN